MSSRAQRLTSASARVNAFEWSGDEWSVEPSLAPAHVPQAPPPPAIDVDAIERDAFTKGYAQGERAGAQAASTRADAMLRRLAQTLEELTRLRAEMIHKTERQLVELAVGIARRVLHREVSLDRDLLLAMARVALDRLGESSGATVRLHPEDFALVDASSLEGAGAALRVVPDTSVARGGCLVQSEFGLIDVSLDAQLTEVSAALLGDEVNARDADAGLES